MSTELIVWLAIAFVALGVSSSVVYYFARYYVKSEESDNELLTKKPIDLSGAPKSENVKIDKLQTEKPPPANNIQSALRSTREGIWGRIAKLSFKDGLKADIKDQLEEILYTSDLGPQTANLLLEAVTEKLSQAELKEILVVQNALRSEILSVFTSLGEARDLFAKLTESSKPVVWMVVGVNGAGKTTTIGKLAYLAKLKGLKTMIVAADTFRAAASEQLRVWTERAGSEIFTQENIKDPSAMAYAGFEKAKNSNIDLVIVDTAGRLHTQAHLMEELKKIKRVLAKLDSQAPQETILVIDANAGQNALQQARDFNAAVELTNVIVTKLDGSSKAGVTVGIVNELHVPIAYVGVGEAVENLQPFDAKAFTEAII